MAARMLVRQGRSYQQMHFVNTRGMCVATKAEDTSGSTSWFQKIKGLFIRDKPEEAAASKTTQAKPSMTAKLVSTVKAAVTPAYTLEAFADELKKAREAGAKVKGVPDDRITGILEKQEQMLRALAMYKTSQIAAPQMAEVAAKCGTKVEDVEDIFSKYMWTKEAYNKVEKLKQEGKPLPKSFDEVEELMGGRWKSPKSVPIVSRNQLCSCGSNKKYKRCCGQVPKI